MPRRPHRGGLRRERRLLLRAREGLLHDLGGLAVELYRTGGFREDLLAERCAAVLGVDYRLAEIDDLLHARDRPAACACGEPAAAGTRFCTSCGRPVAEALGVPIRDR